MPQHRHHHAIVTDVFGDEFPEPSPTVPPDETQLVVKASRAGVPKRTQDIPQGALNSTALQTRIAKIHWARYFDLSEDAFVIALQGGAPGTGNIDAVRRRLKGNRKEWQSRMCSAVNESNFMCRIISHATSQYDMLAYLWNLCLLLHKRGQFLDDDQLLLDLEYTEIKGKITALRNRWLAAIDAEVVSRLTAHYALVNGLAATADDSREAMVLYREWKSFAAYHEKVANDTATSETADFLEADGVTSKPRRPFFVDLKAGERG